MYWTPSTFWSNAASHHCVAWKHTCATRWVSSDSITWLFCMYTRTDYIALTLMSLHASLLWSLRIVISTFGRIWIALHFVPEHAASHTRTFSETELHLVLCLYAILQHLLGTRYMQSTNIYKAKPILCFRSKNVRTGCKRQGQRMGRGGLATCVCNANEHGPPQLFLHCCAYVLTSITTPDPQTSDMRQIR